MTANQFTAIDIACRVVRGELAESDLDDAQWALVSLASSLGHSRCLPKAVFHKVIADFRAPAGFFADLSENDLAEWEPMLPMTTTNLPPLADFPPPFHVAR
jgi:hypothetical protein